ncbi:helix-turn-helix domain-containing protein [Novosphingobium sp.]|uniref:helix-turn-helix transcriptional regulator n=1 Tax=Novosphingobium sp. TaxID=1874826 RepID=UPI001ECABFD0|nr:helix-turn-helix domain-containing protein [Novosphingobium sp.]MBK9009427.1 helix-turn-helix domain-containing protein [Novosphingobium sp.]
MSVLNNEEAASALGISPNTLKRWRHLGKGPSYIKLGDAKQAGVVYESGDIDAWKADRKFASTSAATVSYPGSVDELNLNSRRNTGRDKIVGLQPTNPESLSYPEGA